VIEVVYFEEYQDRVTKLVSNGTVLAILAGRGLFYDNKNGVTVGAIAASKDGRITPTCIPISYLHHVCKKITEVQAREMYPALCAYIDARNNPSITRVKRGKPHIVIRPLYGTCKGVPYSSADENRGVGHAFTRTI